MWRPDVWLAFLRIVVGVVVLRNAWPKFTLAWLGGVVPYLRVAPGHLAEYERRIAQFTEGTPLGWHRDFLREVVAPHSSLAASLHAWGELATAVGLLLGLLVGLAALIGLFLTLNVSLGTYVPGAGPPAVHWLLPAAMFAFLATRAGRLWGVDAILRRRAAKGTRVLLAPLT